MNIPDEVLDEATVAWWQDYTDEDNLDSMSAASAITLREAMGAAAPIIAEWARKEALDEVLCVAEQNRVILRTVRRGYTVEEFGDPLVRIAIIRALAEGVSDGQQ